MKKVEGKKNERDQRQVKSKRETNRRNMKIGCRCNTNMRKRGMRTEEEKTKR